VFFFSLLLIDHLLYYDRFHVFSHSSLLLLLLLLLLEKKNTGVECNDEISTGLDAATTYDISKILGETTRIRHTVRIVSLLQPSPETVALFDELILLAEGRILYAGPVDEVTRHFKSLGYEQPDRMDPVDWLQVSKNLS
jgi:ABC-type multidrug transport system ATPase subunit